MDEVQILDDQRECPNCGVREEVNRLGRCDTSTQLVTDYCLPCTRSKNAAMVEQANRMASRLPESIRPPTIEQKDNWRPIQVGTQGAPNP